eukprot:2729418-Rhodomonas_salina.3
MRSSHVAYSPTRCPVLTVPNEQSYEIAGTKLAYGATRRAAPIVDIGQWVKDYSTQRYAGAACVGDLTATWGSQRQGRSHGSSCSKRPITAPVQLPHLFLTAMLHDVRITARYDKSGTGLAYGAMRLRAR